VSQTGGASSSQCNSGGLAANFPPPPLLPLAPGSVESVPPSPGRASRYQTDDDSPSGKPSYTLLTSPSPVHRGHVTSLQHPAYLHAYGGYADMPPLALEKVSRSKVLPNEVCPA